MAMTPSFAPLAPSVKWWSRYMTCLTRGSGKGNAICETNREIARPKDFGRIYMADNRQQALALSLAIEGGGRQLRDYYKIPGLKISEHGDWRRIHLGAFESILGKKPYFRHYIDKISDIYNDTGLTSLQAFNTAIFEALCSFLLKNVSIESLRDFQQNHLLVARGKEIAASMFSDLSVIQALSAFGNETLLGILTIDSNFTNFGDIE